ncbi:lectin BRA-3-like [Haliotis asinina]|uniref:lectin BRA-3-like n=1 Tax=Haliotis asinina TaxID=109174 RepID=UPI0035324CEB
MVSVITHLSLELIVATVLFPLASGVCPTDFTDTRSETGTCLYFSNTQKNWYDARQDCVRRGGELVRVTSMAVVKACYTNIVSKGNNEYWIGLNDIMLDGDYRWPQGEALTWSYWGSYNAYTQPNDNSHQQNCHLCDISGPMQPKCSWQDKICQDSYNYICEYFPDKDSTMQTARFRRRTDVSNLVNMEIASSPAHSHRQQCAAACLHTGMCDGFAFSKVLSKCLFLQLKENSPSERDYVRSEIGACDVFLRAG